MTDEYIRFSERMEQPYEPEIYKCRSCNREFDVIAHDQAFQGFIDVSSTVNFCPYCGGGLGPFGPLDDEYAGISPDCEWRDAMKGLTNERLIMLALSVLLVDHYEDDPRIEHIADELSLRSSGMRGLMSDIETLKEKQQELLDIVRKKSCSAQD